jgi:pyruvate,water dikinase
MALGLAGLHEIDAARDGRFGGKACGLARLIAAGARVPDGFAIAATSEPPSAWSPADREALRRRAALLLARGPLAVRSSALVEDAAQRSFAGLFDSVLNARDEGLLDAVARCIASGGGERVRAYAGLVGPDGPDDAAAAAARAPLPVAVVVQSMVAARSAGVCFTVDPLGLDSAVVVEAVAGTGDALVSGRARPERWRVYRTGLGAWEARRADSGPDGSVLSADEAAALAVEASGLATRLGRPLDLEWAIAADSRPWWLQARPVTSAKPPPRFAVQRYLDGVDDGPITVWSNWNVREVMPEPFPPLAWTLWRDVVLPSVCEPMFGLPRSSPAFPHVVPVDLVHGRVFWNMNALLAAPVLGHLFLRALASIDARAAAAMSGLRDSGVLTRRRLPGSSLALALRMLAASLRASRGLLGALRPRGRLRELAECAAAVDRRRPLAELRDEELLVEMRLLALPECDAFRDGQEAMGAGMALFMLAERAFRPHPAAHRLLTAGVSGNPTTEISIGVDELVRAAQPLASLFAEARPAAELPARLREHPGGAAWLAGLERFLARFGHRCPNEFDLGAPRWSEDPAMVLALVRTGLRAPVGEGVEQRLRRLRRQRERAVAAAVRRAPAWRRPLLRWLARVVAEFMPLREAPKHHAMRAYARMRLAALCLGERLAARGVIDAPDDVLFLEWPEVQALARERGPRDVRGLVRQRRALFARFQAERAPDFLRSDGVPVEDPAPPVLARGALQGVAASGGRARGVARVLRAPDPEALAHGEVLVVEFADPGWTPLFPRAAAVVMEVGGLMCHAAVVARELGIPGVFGVAGATRLLAGREVAVDGDRGTVTPCDQAPP